MIKIYIERHFVEGMEAELDRVLRDVIHSAVCAPGYLSGEILRDVNDHNHYVVTSNWRSQAHWDEWLVSEARQHSMSRILPMLREPERILVTEPM